MRSSGRSLHEVRVCEEMTALPDAAEARTMLLQVKQHIDPLLAARGWRIERLIEICCCDRRNMGTTLGIGLTTHTNAGSCVLFASFFSSFLTARGRLARRRLVSIRRVGVCGGGGGAPAAAAEVARALAARTQHRSGDSRDDAHYHRPV